MYKKENFQLRNSLHIWKDKEKLLARCCFLNDMSQMNVHKKVKKLFAATCCCVTKLNIISFLHSRCLFCCTSVKDWYKEFRNF